MSSLDAHTGLFPKFMQNERTITPKSFPGITLPLDSDSCYYNSAYFSNELANHLVLEHKLDISIYSS